MFQKQDPVTSVSTAPAAQLINAIDDGIQSLARQCDEMNQLMSQARSTNVASEPTIALQKNVDALRQKVLSLTQDISMIREAHASIAQMQPLAPVQPNDPMMASQDQQPPMNPMGGGMGGMGV
tara:strand:- start:60907 stop:61275 length:369 start_codon:yes stop_codon:yes gene_type:complete